MSDRGLQDLSTAGMLNGKSIKFCTFEYSPKSNNRESGAILVQIGLI